MQYNSYQEENKSEMIEQLKELCIRKTEGNGMLEDCLNGYTKIRLSQIGEAYDYKIPQSKKKAEIVFFLAAVIKSDLIRYFTEEGNPAAARVHSIAQSGGQVITEEDLELIRGPLDRGIVFLRKENDEIVAFLPGDVMAIFEAGREGSRKESREERIFREAPVHKKADMDRTPEEEEMIGYASALAHIYGIFQVRLVREVWDLNHGKHLAPHKEEELIEKAGDEDGFYRRDNYIIDSQLTDPEDYCNVLDRIMPSDNYFYPTVSEMEEYKDGAVMNEDIHKYYLRNFLARMLGMDVPVLEDDEKLDHIMGKLAFAAKCDNTLSQVLMAIESEGIVLNDGMEQTRFVNLYTGWMYGMRIWACKGYKPKDLPPAKMSVRNFRIPANLDPKAEIVIGRNDPCPCGSGKKYKKCCFRCV